MKDMDLRDFREMPDEGLFEKIERRLLVRRWLRIGGVTMAVAALVVAGVWLMKPDAEDGQVAQMAVAEAETTSPQAVVPTATVDDLSMAPATVGRQVAEASVAVAENTSLSTVTVQPLTPVVSVAEVANMPAQPVLPSTSVAPSKTDVADLIVDPQTTETSVVTAPQPKSGTPVPEQPHEDNVLWAPNAIAPDFEDEAVREFKLLATSAITDFRLVIVNRAGRQVYSSSDINQGWDGSYNGQRMPQGAYVWVARFRDSDGNARQERGTVTVIR